MHVLTAGTGNRSFNDLVRLFCENGVTLIIDVRSKPYSGWNAQFNKPYLQKHLPMRYWAWGDVLGGLEDIPAHVFEMAVDEVVMLARQERICLMCSELRAEPTKTLPTGCHRWRVIAPALERRGIRVVHL